MKIRQHVKKTFLPSKHNDYHPHLIRHYGLAAVITAILLITTVTNFLETGRFQVLGYATDVGTSGLFSETNYNRLGGGLIGLTLNGQLINAAQQKANHMIANDYWAHVAPDGTTPWYFIDGSGYQYLKAGENLAYGFLTSSGVVQGWMDSPGHRANIMEAAFLDVGFGIANGESYQGAENTVVVAMYGQPLPATIPASPDVIEENQGVPATQDSGQGEEATTDSQPSSNDGETELIEVTTPIEGLQVVSTDQYDGEVFVKGPVLAGSVDGRIVSNLEALLTGRATPAMYATIGLLLIVGMIYLARHLRALHQVVIHGVHSLKGHPMLEASLVYLVIWMVLRATYGVIL